MTISKTIQMIERWEMQITSQKKFSENIEFDDMMIYGLTTIGD